MRKKKQEKANNVLETRNVCIQQASERKKLKKHEKFDSTPYVEENKKI